MKLASIKSAHGFINRFDKTLVEDKMAQMGFA